MDARLNDLPQDRESLEAILRALLLERDEQRLRAEQQTQRADELYLQNLRLQLELERYKKWCYGPRADRLATSGDVAQALLEFAEQLEAKPIHPEDVPAKAEPEYELRRVKRRPGRRHLAHFENLPVTGCRRRHRANYNTWGQHYCRCDLTRRQSRLDPGH